jgi:hypothetical protein
VARVRAVRGGGSARRLPQPAGFDAQAFIEEETIWPGTSIWVRLKRVIQDADGSPGGFTDQMFDLISDPWEQFPGHYASAPASVRARFDAYLASLPARAP